MDANLESWRRQGLLYPTMLIAAIAVIIFSMVGIAAMTGLLPSALSGYRVPEDTPAPVKRLPQDVPRALDVPRATGSPALDVPRATGSPALDVPQASVSSAPDVSRGSRDTAVAGTRAARDARAGREPQATKARAAACTECGVVESVRALEHKGEGTMLGAGAGALVGGLLGNQVGSGNGRTAATVAAAGVGAFAGNEVERKMNTRITYQVRVRMEDGSHRNHYQATSPTLSVGQHVRLADGRVIPD